MANRRMALSGEGKEILEKLAISLEIERPMAVKVALAKGISVSDGPVTEKYSGDGDKWDIPVGIIKDKEFLLFKHLIINEIGIPLNDEELHKHMLTFIEKGLRAINDELENKTSMEDVRLAIL